ncbi:UNVERIFIED_CONTAM: ATP binding [Siphonaria sp. JEL0065]|nr:ATP binding [Siphonaria sp. JEL0065]
MNPAASKIWEKCIKVYLIGIGDDKVTTMIDIANSADGTAIRNKILSHYKFRLPKDLFPDMALFAAKDAAGTFDLVRNLELVRVRSDGRTEDQPLDDIALFVLSRSSTERDIKSVQIAVIHEDTANNVILEKCVRVHSLMGESRSIDVSKHSSGSAIREEIFKKFRMTSPEERAGFEIYSLNSEGGLDSGLEIDDSALYDISKSHDFDKKSLLFLLKRQEFTERGLDLEAAISSAVRKSPSQIQLRKPGSRGSFDQERRTSEDNPTSAGSSPASPLNSLRLAWRGSLGSLPTKPPANQLPPSPSRSIAPSARTLLASITQNQFQPPLPSPPILASRSSSFNNSLRPTPSIQTFADNQSIYSANFYRAQRSLPRRGSGSFLSNGSSRAFPGDFPGERPAIETIAQNLEVFFPKMQPLDTSDAMQGVVWFHEDDVEGVSEELEKDVSDIADGSEEVGVTRVSSIRKADVAARSIHNGSIGGGRHGTSLRMSTISSRKSKISLPSSVPGSPVSPHSFNWEGKVGVQNIPSSIAVKKGGFRERLARLGSGGLFMTRDTAAPLSHSAYSQQLEQLSKQMSRQHLVSNLAQVGLLERIPLKSPSNSALSSPVEVRRPEFDAMVAEKFRRNLSTLVEGDSEDLVELEGSTSQLIDEADDNETHLISFDGSEIDIYSSFTSSDDSGDKIDENGGPPRLEVAEEEEVPMQIRWKGFLFKPNPTPSSPAPGGSSSKWSLGVRPSFNPSLGIAIDSQTIRKGSPVGTFSESMDLDTPTAPSLQNITLQQVSTPGSSITLTPPSPANTISAPPPSVVNPTPSSINPDSPEIFTDQDVSPPVRRRIRWIKGGMIGKGSFGSVFYGVNLNTQEVMAVKQIDVIPISKFRNKVEAEKNREKMIESLRSEILLLNELAHENVVRYLGFDIDNTLVSVFLEYVGGGSVASMLSKFGRFEENISQTLLAQILNGLEYLHDRCIIHRDIKGANILVNMDGSVKISDFGISKKNELNMAYQINSKMEFAGSVFWMAPEMSKNSGYSAKIDIWALGCVALEMFTGSHPWNGKGHMQAMWELRQGNAPPVPPGLSRDAMVFLAYCFKIYVSVTQSLSGSVTATLYLDSAYISNIAAGSDTISLEFDYPLGILCKATASVQTPSFACPSAMQARGSNCLAVSCQASTPSRSDTYQIQAQFSICPRSDLQCGLYDMAVSAQTKLGSGGSDNNGGDFVGPAPGGANVPDLPKATTAAGTATTTGGNSSGSNSNVGQVTLNVGNTNQPSSNPSPVLIGVGSVIALALLGALGFLMHRRRKSRAAAASADDDQLSQIYVNREPIRFEEPLPAVPSEKGVARMNTSNSAFNTAKPVQLGALERAPSVKSTKFPKAFPEGRLVDPSGKEATAIEQFQPVYMQQQQQPIYGAAAYVVPQQGQPMQYAQYSAAPGAQNAYPPPQHAQHPGYYDVNGVYHFYNQQ